MPAEKRNKRDTVHIIWTSLIYGSAGQTQLPSYTSWLVSLLAPAPLPPRLNRFPSLQEHPQYQNLPQKIHPLMMMDSETFQQLVVEEPSQR